MDQFAYLYTTQALIISVEKFKKGIIDGQKAGTVFFDFLDAFGSINRDRLLHKLEKTLEYLEN